MLCDLSRWPPVFLYYCDALKMLRQSRRWQEVLVHWIFVCFQCEILAKPWLAVLFSVNAFICHPSSFSYSIGPLLRNLLRRKLVRRRRTLWFLSFTTLFSVSFATTFNVSVNVYPFSPRPLDLASFTWQFNWSNLSNFPALHFFATCFPIFENCRRLLNSQSFFLSLSTHYWYCLSMVVFLRYYNALQDFGPLA